MNVEEYYAAVERLDLKPSEIPHVYRCPKDGTCHSVPNPAGRSDEERAAIIARLALMRGGY
jgi:hypothetical protein